MFGLKLKKKIFDLNIEIDSSKSQIISNAL